MFDVTAEDISRLDDKQLGTLVARLCEAELAAQNLSPSLVTWGGNQAAVDGGRDVRVSIPSGLHFIPGLSLADPLCSR